MKLWLIRHAKSDWKSAARSDFERPLNARGKQDGPRMAAWLAGQDGAASWIWSSDAVRAAATARFVAEGFAGARLVEDHRVYDAGPEQLLEVIRETPPDVTSAAVVGHNPGMTALVNLLEGADVIDELPTFAIARLEVPPPWVDLAFGRGTVEILTSPKRLMETPP